MSKEQSPEEPIKNTKTDLNLAFAGVRAKLEANPELTAEELATALAEFDAATTQAETESNPQP